MTYLKPILQSLQTDAEEATCRCVGIHCAFPTNSLWCIVQYDTHCRDIQ